MSSIRDLIYSSLKNNGYYCKYESNGREVASRCPYCGGSNSNKYKRQFYIKVDKPPYLFHCFRCGVSGTIAKLVMDFPDLFLPVIKNIGLELLKYEDETPTEEQSIVTTIQDDDLCEDCKIYLESRLSTTTIDRIKDRIVCCKNLESVDSSLSNFIGFKTIDDSTIVARNKDSSSNFRYKNLKLSEKREFGYFVTSVIEDYRLDHICVIGEGIFTTLSALESIKNLYSSVNVIGIASLSKSRLYYTSKFVVNQLPVKFKEIYIVVDKDEDYENQIQKLSTLCKDDNRYRLVVPTRYKDMNESRYSFEIKYF